MEAALVIALILSNFFWLAFYDRSDTRNKDERREIRNRLAEPDMVIPPDEVVKANIEAIQTTPDEGRPDDEWELAAVGRIDPILNRPDK